MLGPEKERHLERTVAVSLEAYVPPDHFYRQLHTKLDLSFVRAWVADKYAAIGRPSIDPVVFFKLELLLFFEGLRSERKLLEIAHLHLGYRWYLGYNLDEPLPDHSSLSKIRRRLGVETFQHFFDHVVDLCQDAGLVWGKELFFDSTNVRANADIDSLVPRFYQQAKQQAQAHLAELFAGDTNGSEPTGDPNPADAAAAPTGSTDTAAAAADACAADPAAPVPLPFAGTPTEQAALAAENQAQWKLLDERRLDPQRPPSGPYRRTTDFLVSTTDPDAAPMSKGGPVTLGYHDQYVVDGGKARIIVGVLVTPADVQDNQVLLDPLDRAQFRFHLHVKRAVADALYATGENLHGLAARGITAYMPVTDREQATPFFKHQDFTYDPATDTYRCPNGATLRYRGNNYTTRVRVYYAPTATCAGCPLRARCTDSTEGRKLNRNFDEDYRELARLRQTTEAYQKALRKRRVWVEPLFGEAKDWHQLRQFRLRGLANVNMVGLLVAAGQNLKRYLAAVRRGHRPAEGQRAIAVRPTLYPV
jgi:transposase